MLNSHINLSYICSTYGNIMDEQVSLSNISDLSMLRNAVISIGGKKLLYNYYDENFITSK